MAKSTIKAAATVKAPKAPKVLPECTCGCGTKTKGGKFLPGHDAKLKSRLVTAAKEGNTKATATLRELGWAKFIPAAGTNGTTKAKVKATAKA